jgi:hypothetical protein
VFSCVFFKNIERRTKSEKPSNSDKSTDSEITIFFMGDHILQILKGWSIFPCHVIRSGNQDAVATGSVKCILVSVSGNKIASPFSAVTPTSHPAVGDRVCYISSLLWHSKATCRTQPATQTSARAAHMLGCFPGSIYSFVVYLMMLSVAGTV